MRAPHLLLFDQHPAVISAWRKHFAADAVTIVRCRFEDLEQQAKVHHHKPLDAFAAAGNSYGVMDGTLDLAMAEHRSGLQSGLRQVIQREHHGYLPVGTAAWVPCADFSGASACIYAPTMRQPMSLHGHEQLNVFDAMWSILREAAQHPEVQLLAVPGLGTGAGAVRPEVSAALMHEAYRQFLTGRTAACSAVTARQRFKRVLDQLQA